MSSTFSDLIEERQDTINSILDMNHIPAGMELFPASDIDQFEYIKKIIDQCDYYLLIVGGRYGSLDKDGVSFTEKEFDYAVQTKKFIIAFLHKEPESLSVNKSETSEDSRKLLTAFRDKVGDGRLVKFWTSRENLTLLVLQSLNHAFNDHPQIGWIRGDSAASEQVLEQANKALIENIELRAKIAKLIEAAEPAFDDLADLDDTIELRYRTRSNNGYQSSVRYTYHDRVCTVSWKQIFLAVARNLTTPSTEVVIEKAFKDLADDIKLGYTSYDLNKSDLTMIKHQLIALGLITTGSTTNPNKNSAFLALTDKGRNFLMNSMVVRKKSVPVENT